MKQRPAHRGTPGKVYHFWLKQLSECWTSDCTFSAVRAERDCLTGPISLSDYGTSLSGSSGRVSSLACLHLPPLSSRLLRLAKVSRFAWRKCRGIQALGKDDPLGLPVRVFVCVSEREVVQHTPSAVLRRTRRSCLSHVFVCMPERQVEDHNPFAIVSLA